MRILPRLHITFFLVGLVVYLANAQKPAYCDFVPFDLNGGFGPACAIDSQNFFVLGSGGRMIKSRNGTSNWEEMPRYTFSSPSSVKFISNQIGFVWDASETIFKTEDGGYHWFQLPFKKAYGFHYNLRPYFHSEQTMFVIEEQLLHVTHDGGKTWRNQYLNFEPIHLFALSDSTIMISSKSSVYKSTNGGKSWVEKPIPNAQAISNIQFLNASLGFAIESSALGKIYKTMDGGTTWRETSLPFGYASTARLLFADENLGFIGYTDVNNSSRIFYTKDGGSTWEDNGFFFHQMTGMAYAHKGSNLLVTGVSGYTSSGTYIFAFKDLLNVEFVSIMDGYNSNFNKVEQWGNTLYVHGSRIFKSEDNGTIWQPVNYHYFDRMHMLNADSIYFFYNGKLCRTKDAWKTVDTLWRTESNFLQDLHFLDFNTGFISLFGNILRTKDAGITWDTVHNNHNNEGYRSIAFASDSLGFAAGIFHMMVTRDRGKTWKPLENFPSATYYSVSFQGNVGHIGGADGLLYLSKDKGATWQKIGTTNMSNLRVYDVCFRNEQEGLLVTSNGGSVSNLYVTQDGGNSWKYLTQYSEHLWDAELSPTGEYYFVGDKSIVVKLEREVPRPLPGYIIGKDTVAMGSPSVFEVPSREYEKFRWNTDGPTTISKDSNKVNITFSDTGTYTLQVRLVDDCGESQVRTKQVVVLKNILTSLVNSEKEKATLLCYPNPASESLSLSLPQGSEGPVEIIVRSVQSITVEQKKYTNSDGKLTLSVGHLLPGVYVIEAVTPSKSYHRTFTKL